MADDAPLERVDQKGASVMRRVTIALALILAGCVAPPVSADEGTLTLAGVKNAGTWLVVKRTIRYDLAASTIEYTGTYGGFAIGKDFVRMRSKWDVRKQPTFDGFSATNGRLAPGRYVVRVFGDGNTTVSLPWTGRDVTLPVTRPISASLETQTSLVPGGKLAAQTSGVPGVSGDEVFVWERRAVDNFDVIVKVDTVAGPVAPLRMVACLTSTRSSCSNASVTATDEAKGTALNTFAVGMHAYGRPERWVRVELNGALNAGVVGVATAVVHYFDRTETP